MTELKTFMWLNQISQKELSDYLKISTSFLSQIATGAKKLPNEHLETLLANDRGWDTSPLAGTSAKVNLSGSNVNSGNVNTTIQTDEAYIATLKEQIASLQDQLAWMRQVLDDYRAMLKQQ